MGERSKSCLKAFWCGFQLGLDALCRQLGKRPEEERLPLSADLSSACSSPRDMELSRAQLNPSQSSKPEAGAQPQLWANPTGF